MQLRSTDFIYFIVCNSVSLLFFSGQIASTTWAQTSSNSAKVERLDLSQAYQRLQKSPQWIQTQIPSLEAEAKNQQASAALRPHLRAFTRQAIVKTNPLNFGLKTSDSQLQGMDVLGVGSTGIEAEWSLLSFFNRDRRDAAEVNQQLGRAQTQQYQNDLSFLMFLKFAQTQLQQRKIKYFRYQLKKDQEFLKLVELKSQVGAGTRAEKSKAEMLIAQDELRLLEAEQNQRQAAEDLEDLIGKDLNQSDEIRSLELPDLQFRAFRTNNQRSSQNFGRLEMQVDELSLKTTRELANAVSSESLPQITLYSEVATVGPQFLGLVNQPTGAIGIQMKMPIFDGGYIQGKKNEALAKVLYLEHQQKKRKVTMNHQQQQAIEKIVLSEKAYEVSLRALQLSDNEIQMIEKKMRLGSNGSIDLWTARGNYLQALDAHNQALFAQQAAKINYFHLQGDVESYLAHEQQAGSQ